MPIKKIQKILLIIEGERCIYILPDFSNNSNNIKFYLISLKQNLSHFDNDFLRHMYNAHLIGTVNYLLTTRKKGTNSLVFFLNQLQLIIKPHP